MNFAPYPRYKASGVEWLSDVPEHWEVKRVKNISFALTQKSAHSEFQVALENIEGWSGRFLATEGAFDGDGIAFAAGDVLFGKLRPYLAKVYLAEKGGEAVGDFIVIRPKEIVLGRFIQYQFLTREFVEIVNGATYGSKMPRVSWEFLGGQLTACPPIPEQRVIAAFLDRETAKIDALVEEQRKLIELLKEKRQALITHAVTKGLNPKAKMKDSGIEWLGQVPEHWDVVRIKRVSDLQSGAYLDSDKVREEGAFEVYGGGGLRGYTLKYNVEGKHVLIGRQGALCGNITLATGRFWATEHAVVVYPIREYNTDWLALTLHAMDLNKYAMSAAQPGLSVETLSKLSIPLPPMEEQDLIAESVLKISTWTSSGITIASNAIELLLERRSALISAAVTGKIDVRDMIDEEATT